MALTPEQVKIVRRHRVELIMLGMVLARTGDRDYILNELLPNDVHSDVVMDCLEAIRGQERAPLVRAFKSWGIEIDEKRVSHAVVSRITELGAEERARELLNRALQTGNTTELAEALKSATLALGVDEDVEVSEFGNDQQE